MERFYTLDETADLLHMHTRTVRNRIRDGKLKATKPGRRILIAESDLLAYMESTAAGTPAGAAETAAADGNGGGGG